MACGKPARRLAEAEAAAHEVMAVTGHKTLAEVQRFTEPAMREGLADSAHAKLLSRPNREQAVGNLPHRFAIKSTKQMKKRINICRMVGPEGLEPPTKAL